MTDHVIAATDYLRTDFRTITDHSRATDQGLFTDDLIAIKDRCTMHQIRTNYGLNHGPRTTHRPISSYATVTRPCYGPVDACVYLDNENA